MIKLQLKTKDNDKLMRYYNNTASSLEKRPQCDPSEAMSRDCFIQILTNVHHNNSTKVNIVLNDKLYEV